MCLEHKPTGSRNYSAHILYYIHVLTNVQQLLIMIEVLKNVLYNCALSDDGPVRPETVWNLLFITLL